VTRIGVVLNITAQERRSDGRTFRDHMALGDLVEPLGFDSLFVLEHHFSSYVLSPAPFEILAYFAGRTSRIDLGTAVVVLPWHDPVRIAEQISVLDILSNGRCLFAFGRGRSRQEFEGFRIPIAEASERYAEAAEVVVTGLKNSEFSYDGKFYRIPRCSIRPRPITNPQDRLYGASTSHESAAVNARLGLGLLLSTSKAWSTLGAEVTHYHELVSKTGCSWKGPIVLSSVYVAEDRQAARRKASEYVDRDWTLLEEHYRFTSSHLSSEAGYEGLRDTEQFFEQLSSPSFRKEATEDRVLQQIVGTPNDCATQIQELFRTTKMERLVLEFSYGGMPIAEAEENMRLFAASVLPEVSQLS